MNGRCDSRIGEILLQSLLVNGIFTKGEHPCHLDFFRQFLSPFGIVVHEVDMHILEKTTLAEDKVVIGSFSLRFERTGSQPGQRVAAQGLFTARSNGYDTQVKFTSSTYQFKVHIIGQDPPAMILSHNNFTVKMEPIPFPSGQ
ncbi:MAG: hypothetical protein A4E38_01180 [Methanoregulaceae archaeon PtaB.Bin108]|nr:MAG: hypothetical protein A4E38_01180 [Methanoregulaceae archaeon PtaB.Bin108]OPY40606.1 MAG: hypothetical protein A4E42_02097 [Methanoregulaceae archaeon PtaU1.Bin222]